jgi:tRNA1(Val) A37 N6-methylase TrmN6
MIGQHLLLYQPLNGYCYNSDTHFLHHFIQQCLHSFKNVKGDLLDIGSGSGILGLLMARDFPKLKLHQCEIQNEFQFLSTKNAQVNGIETTLFKGQFQSLHFDKRFDMCVSNPPFYHSNVVKSDNENLRIARYNDSMPLSEFIGKAARVLKNEGKFFFCYDVKQINDIIITLRENKFNIEALQFVHPKKNKDATLVLVYARRQSKSLSKILSPLFVFEGNEFSQEVQAIYEHSATHSIKVQVS